MLICNGQSMPTMKMFYMQKQRKREENFNYVSTEQSTSTLNMRLLTMKT